MFLDNFIKGFCLIWKSDNNSYHSLKTFKDIFWTNVNIFSITVFVNNLRLALPSYPFSDILYYTFILRIFINGIIANTFMNMTLGRIVLNTYREKNLTMNIQESNSFSELIFKETKIAFYSKLYYIGELLTISLLPTQSLYYRIFSVYFYGKYMTEIYLNIRDISSRIHNRYLSRLIFYRLGIGCAIALLLWLFEIVVGTYSPDLLTRIIFNDCIFNVIYGYYVLSFEDLKQSPQLEDYEPFFFPMKSDYFFRCILFLISKCVKNIKIPSKYIPYVNDIFNKFAIIFIDNRIREDPLSYPPILHCVEVYQKEILQVLHHLLLYNKIGPFINDKVILFFLSIWVPRELIKLLIIILNKVDYQSIKKLNDRIQNLEVDFFILIENKKEDNFTLIQQAVSLEEGVHFYLSEAKKLTHQEILSIRAKSSDSSPTVNISLPIPTINGEIIDNHFK